jgi:hypothetical protein
MQQTISFGRYRGRSLDRVPDGYLCWLLEHVDLEDDDREAVCRRLGEDPDRWPNRRELKERLGELTRLEDAAVAVLYELQLEQFEGLTHRECFSRAHRDPHFAERYAAWVTRLAGPGSFRRWMDRLRAGEAAALSGSLGPGHRQLDRDYYDGFSRR